MPEAIQPRPEIDPEKDESITFETALERLEQVVNELEGGDRSLEDALAFYQEGVRLVRYCSKELEEAEAQVEILTGDERVEGWRENGEEPVVEGEGA